MPSSSITWSEMGKQNVQAEKVYMSSSLLKTDSSFGTSQVSLSKTDHSKLREELGEINFFWIDEDSSYSAPNTYICVMINAKLIYYWWQLHYTAQVCAFRCSFLRGGEVYWGNHVTFLPACFRLTFFVVLQYLGGRNFYLTFTFFFSAFFFSCLFVFLLLLFVLSSGR